jgi:transposase, IS30 family
VEDVTTKNAILSYVFFERIAFFSTWGNLFSYLDGYAAPSLKQAFEQLATYFPSGTFRTATVDRGKEFACYQALEKKFGVEVYFADPYSSWQRGTNENANGLLREFFPKGTDLAKVSEEELESALHLINHRPRKCLGWKSAHEAFQEELLHLA